MPSRLRFCVRRYPAGDPDARTTVVTLSVPTDIDCIEEAVALVTFHCLSGTAARETVRFRLQVALSEALANAIIRGNHGDRSKLVRVRAELGADAIRIHVTDEGAGFDPAAVPEPLGPEGLQRANGRGLFLIRSLVDAVEFNDRGNSICMILRRP
ncbi:MAG: ATP-binding protein [Gemmatimonadota bacterium]